MGRVLVTGCSTGFGRATAVELTKRGHDVVATARRAASRSRTSTSPTRLALDVDDDASVASAVAEAGDLDALVNNAGFGISGPIEQLPIDEVRAVMETNCFGVVRMVQAVVPSMRERGSGTIVNVSSVAGRVAPPLGGLLRGVEVRGRGPDARRCTTRSVTSGSGCGSSSRASSRPTSRTRSTRFGLDGAPYDELEAEWQRARASARRRGAAGPEAVAAAIADAIESDEPQAAVAGR